MSKIPAIEGTAQIRIRKAPQMEKKLIKNILRMKGGNIDSAQ